MFESQGNTGMVRSPGGFDFGIQGWVYGEPRPTSITFYLDNTASVCDQYGRHIRRAIVSTGEIHFADRPPDAPKDGTIEPRPQFATHIQVVAALVEERINWQAYTVLYRTTSNQIREKKGLVLEEAAKLQHKLIQEGQHDVAVLREVAYAGWPQLPYAELKKLAELPTTPIEELRKILDPVLRRDALRVRREAEEVRTKEAQAAAAEE